MTNPSTRSATTSWTRFLEFLAARARPNTGRASAHDLKVFFDVVGKEPADVVPAEVLAFVSAQRRARPGAERRAGSDGSGGLSEATIKRRLAAVSSLYGYLIKLGGIVEANPVPRGLPTRRSRRELRGVPLVRARVHPHLRRQRDPRGRQR